MGPTGTPTEIPHGETVVLVGRRPGQRGALLDRPALRARGSQGASTSPATRSSPTATSVDDIEAAADVVVWCCDEAPGFAPRRPQDRAFVGNIVQAMAGLRLRRRSARRRSRSQDADRIIAIGSDRMMAAVAQRAPRRAAALPQAGSRRDRLDQLADAMHDERDLRAVPAAARRSADRQDDATSSPASTRTSRSTRSTSPRLAQRLAQNGVQEKLTALWIGRCLKAAASVSLITMTGKRPSPYQSR